MTSQIMQKSGKDVLVVKIIVAFMLLLSPAIVLLSSFNTLLFSGSFYSYEFEKNEVYSFMPDADDISYEITGYLKDGERSQEFYDALSADELVHMHDVRAVITRINILFYIILIAYLILFLILLSRLKKNTRIIYSSVLRYSAIFSAAVTLMFSLFLINFRLSFNIMHMLLFDPGTWQFNPSSTLLTLFGGTFFMDFAIALVVLSFVISAVLYVAGVYLSKNKHKKG